MPLIAILGGHSSGVMAVETIAACADAGQPLRMLGFLNDTVAPDGAIDGIPVVGRFEDWRSLDEDVRFLAAFPLPGHAAERFARLRALGIPDQRFLTLCDPTARVSPRARLGHGCYVAAGAVVEHGAVVGAHAIVRAGAYVSHDVTLGDFTFVGPHATVLGRTRCGEGVHVGANAVCREGSTIGAYATIGIGAVVVRDVAAGEVVAGNPARAVR